MIEIKEVNNFLHNNFALSMANNIFSKSFTNQDKMIVTSIYNNCPALLEDYNIKNGNLLYNVIKHNASVDLVKLLIKSLTKCVGVENNIKQAFIEACINGSEASAILLYQNFSYIDIHANDDYAFRYACINGQLDSAKWIYYACNCKIDISIYEDFTFVYSCANGHLEVAQWLLSIYPRIDIRSQGDYAFKNACKNGYLEEAQWLFSLAPKIDVSAGNEYAFRYACARGHLELAQWLNTIKPSINIRAVEDQALISSYCEGHKNIIKYLLELDPTLCNSKYLKHSINWLIKQGKEELVKEMSKIFYE